ncbi:TonB-dependent receptor, partial [Candidatus Kapabacteria bacterium]|nr:TonB-dependent receptor [Candidatus Kapabacteria bacterium]
MIKLIIYLSLFSSIVYSQTIDGLIRDSKTKKALVGSTVLIENSKIGTYTNTNGFFQIQNLEPKVYSLIVSNIGYKTERIKIDLTFKDSISLNIDLSQNFLQTGEVVVSANKRLQAVQDIPISVSIIKSEDLEIRRMNNLEYALDYVPGIQVTRDNVSIRGSSGFSYGVGSRVALLIDGFPMLAADNGDIKMDALPLFNLNQIEIVKGAGSALYGTSAIGGVINIITQDIQDGFQSKFRLYSGYYTPLNYEDWDPGNNPRLDNGFDVSISNKFNDLSLLANVGIVQEDSYRVYDKKEVYNGFVKLGYKVSDKTKINLNTNISISENDDWAFWESAAKPFNPAETVDFSNRVDSDKFSVFGGFDHIINDDFFMNLKSGVYFTRYSNRFDQNDNEYRASDAFAYSFLPQFNNTLSENFLITYGLDFRFNRVQSIVYGNQYQDIYAVYAQSEYSPIYEMDITFGLRYDLENNNGDNSNSQFSPKLGLTYK